MQLNHCNPSTIRSLWPHTYYCDVGEKQNTLQTGDVNVCRELTENNANRFCADSAFHILSPFSGCRLKGQFSQGWNFTNFLKYVFGSAQFSGYSGGSGRDEGVGVCH